MPFIFIQKLSNNVQTNTHTHKYTQAKINAPNRATITTINRISNF